MRQHCAATSRPPDGRAKPGQGVFEILIANVGQSCCDLRRRPWISGALGLASAAPHRRLAQRQPGNRAPAEKLIDALADDAGLMLNLDRRRSLDRSEEHT